MIAMGHVTLICLLLSVGSCQTTKEQHRDRLARFFEDVVFGGLPGDDHTGEQLTRWDGPIRLQVSGAQADTYRQEVWAQLRMAAGLAGLSIEESDAGGEDPNFVVLFAPTKNFPVNERYAPCRAGVRSANGVLFHILIQISVAEKNWVKPCIAHEIAHSFGLFGHSPRVPSVLSPIHGETDFTDWDEMLLGALYDPRLLPGMSKAEAMPVARGIIAEQLAR